MVRDEGDRVETFKCAIGTTEPSLAESGPVTHPWVQWKAAVQRKDRMFARQRWFTPLRYNNPIPMSVVPILTSFFMVDLVRDTGRAHALRDRSAGQFRVGRTHALSQECR